MARVAFLTLAVWVMTVVHAHHLRRWAALPLRCWSLATCILMVWTSMLTLIMTLIHTRERWIMWCVAVALTWAYEVWEYGMVATRVDLDLPPLMRWQVYQHKIAHWTMLMITC